MTLPPTSIFALGNTTPLLAMAISTPTVHDDSLPQCSNGSCPPYGHGHNSFFSCSHCGKLNHLAKKCRKQFSYPPYAKVVVTPSGPFTLALSSIPAPPQRCNLDVG